MQFVTERVKKKVVKKETPAKEPQTIDLNPISEESSSHIDTGRSKVDESMKFT